MNFRLYTLHALSPLHPGTGQGVGLIDLPIARERGSNHPVLPGSSVKGVLRAVSAEGDGGRDGSDTWKIFGPDSNNAHQFASSIRFSDARVLLFPVNSDRGTFAWVTCPFALERLRRDAAQVPGLALPAGGVPVPGEGEAIVCKTSALTLAGPDKALQLVLDGMGYKQSPKHLADAWADALSPLVFPDAAPQAAAWRDMLKARLAIVEDDRFTWLVENATEVRAHIRLNPETGTVAQGALWYEESLPAETVLCGVTQFAPVKQGDAPPWQTLQTLTAAPLQFGGNATTGQGLARFSVVGGGA